MSKPCRDINELAPLAQKALALFLVRCQQEGLAVLVTETYRSQERQNELYEQGRTKPGNIVTQTKSSVHTKRYAWDICKNVKGQEYSDSNFFNRCGAIAKELDITWGGNFSSFKDTPHMQIDTNWKEPKTNNTITILLNGVKKEVTVLSKEGNNYVKLQDLRDSKINIDYDSVKKMPIVSVK